MISPRRTLITLEHGLYILAFVLALTLRLLNLGAAPLSAFESDLALRGLDLAGRAAGPLGSQPVYIVLTGMFFSIFKATDASARLLPAVTGSFLVFLPLLFKTLLGSTTRTRTAGVIFAFAVALDPGLVAVSRMAGSPILALVFSLLAAGFIWQGNAVLAGLLAGLALMSGPDIIQGAAAFGLAVLVALIFPSKFTSHSTISQQTTAQFHDHAFWRKLILFTCLVIVSGGLIWLRFPQGLASLSNTIPAYLAGWLQTSGIPAFRLPATLLLYQPLALIFALVAIARAWWTEPPQPNHNRFLSLWAGCALVLAMIYPSRQVAGLIWTLIPFWLLAASELSQHLPDLSVSTQKLPGIGLASAITLFIFLIWYNLLRLSSLGAQFYLYAAIIGGLILMAVIVIILVTLGWGMDATRFGMVWGTSLILGAYMLSAMWGASQVRPNDPVELWTIAPGTGQVKELLTTIKDLSSWRYGLKNSIDIHTNLSTPDLQWALRDFPNAVYMTTLNYDLLPDVILTGQSQMETGTLSGYRGQQLVWSRTALWQGIFPPNLLRWLTYRELPTTSQPIILWARGDLFPGGVITGTESSLNPVEPVH